MFNADVINERYLIIYASDWNSLGNALYIQDLKEKDPPIIKIVKDFGNDFYAISGIDEKLLVLTNREAPNYQLLSYDLKNISPDNFEVLVPGKSRVLESVTVLNGKIYARYMKDVHNIIEIYDLKGNAIDEIGLPGKGSVQGFTGKKDDSLAFYTYTSYTRPATIYMYNSNKNTSKEFFTPEIDFDKEAYTSSLKFYESKDGTKVPMYVVHKKGIELDGNNPTLLYGYGGFNVTYMPRFRPSNIIWLENGGIYAIAHIRGGGEYGEKWHKAGMKLKKQNVFDDFIGAAEYLISGNYTNPDKLAILGGSNGGLLVGAVINQRPELFEVAFPAVGVMDMLRFHKFTIGGAWVSEYGSSEDSIDFVNLHAYSPIHNIKENIPYPAVMVTTADHDDRVVPAHSFKYIATLQEKYKGENPVLIRIETDAGHSAGKPVSKRIEEAADMWSFAFYNMDIRPYK
jgi:prolyl oligopeptidase